MSPVIKSSLYDVDFWHLQALRRWTRLCQLQDLLFIVTEIMLGFIKFRLISLHGCMGATTEFREMNDQNNGNINDK